jgi:putative redox protein
LNDAILALPSPDRTLESMNLKLITIDALDPAGATRSRFVAQNPRGDRISLEAHHNAPLESDPASVGLGPMEALLAALGSCTAVDVQDIMKKKRTPLSTYRVEIEGIRADSIPQRYTKIIMRHIANGEGVTQENLDKAVRLSFEKYCSVASSLREDIEFVLEIKAR